MRNIKLISCVTTVFIMQLTVSSVLDPFSISTKMSCDTVKSCEILIVDGEVLEINADNLEMRLGMAKNTISGVTITSLPQEEDGILFLDGIEVEAYEYLTRTEVDRLVFVPREGAVKALISLLPNRMKSDFIPANLNIRVLSQSKNAPVLDGFHLDTVKNVQVTGYLNAIDPDNDNLSFRLLSPPKKGKLTFDGASFIYKPFYDLVGIDDFTVCAVDTVGNYSQPAMVHVNIENTQQGFSYCDMQNNPSHYAAIKLREAGVYYGHQIGENSFFFPDRLMFCGDFILLLLQSCGVEVTPAVHSGLPNDAELPQWFKPYAKTAVSLGILPQDKNFNYYEVPTRAEAVLMTDRAAKISDVKSFDLWMSDKGNIPEWSRPSYVNLAAYRMLDLHDGMALPNRALNNGYCADLVWQLYKHIHR